MIHYTVFRRPGRFAGWPANYGIWSWGDEVVVGFTVGYLSLSGGFHARDRSRPFTPMQARSMDGGETWQIQQTPCRTPEGRGLSTDEHMVKDLRLGEVLHAEEFQDVREDIEFTHPDFALMCARSGLRAGARSWFYISYNRCRSWEGPFKLPMFGQLGVAARTDYLVSDATKCTLFLTATKSDGEEGRVFCARTLDAGETFKFLSWIVPEPKGYTIMPASVRLSDSRILVAVRCREMRKAYTEDRAWIDLYASDDDGFTWHYLNRPVSYTGYGGNPPTLTKLFDDRLCLIYGYRAPPYSIRANISADNGETWGKDIILRKGGGNHDIGYPRTVQRPDGLVVTIYYFNDHPERERYIASTIWDPNNV